MTNAIFVVTLATAMAALFCWAFKTLPNERWQMIASVPLFKRQDGAWEGLNLTYYGFFSATGTVLGIAVALLLFASIGVSVVVGLTFAAILIGICVPASRIVAAVVEGKRNTFTIAGAAFTAALLLPPLVWLAERLLRTAMISIYTLTLLAAIAVAYALGEAIGRLACISFGCCYGLPLKHASTLGARLFSKCHMIFHGTTKKVAYASGLENEPLIPVQALTSVIFGASGLLGLSFFLAQQWRLAMIVPVVGTWGWRAVAESLRADDRGNTKIPVYQAMSIIALAYLSAVALALPAAGPVPNLTVGFSLFRFAGVILALQAFWTMLFLFYGRSRVTHSVVSFHVTSS
ncbi:MAG: prolipoprotein diacylglyceryl transferase family protein [Candidatus Korobacteraceae bacterium]